ncbi:5,6-dimethylbenzimidazole synthase [Sphingomonas prati]|uniref:5,6-dimethylbenzimidazole synthase n=1 Tax=Sphingomonas prati TaxID=1843237 RepID=A0A7W9F0S1_9SPHN|nr:5,6-dimethylbenzimidazole synthase [Sphingomonas prati]MBB5728702.1 5,6-dimethylbenzimidazole synthase [Sphingomonas prati]GGE71763.1 5,6-dimethylbenzimidazole synthase [Sphingomonas prati]
MTQAPIFDTHFAERFDQLLDWRRDVRHFRTDPLPPRTLDTLLHAASRAPSVGNSQPWRFVRLRTPQLRDTLAAHVDDANQAAAAAITDPDRRAHYAKLKLHGLREAPDLLAVFSDETPAAGHGLGRATMAETLRYSTVMAIHTLWLAARIRGIGVGWVSILDPAAVTAMIDVPADWTLVALLCIGYPAEPSDIPELERRDWQARESLADRILDR